MDPGTSKSTDGEGAQSEGGVGELDTEMHGPDSEQPGHGGGKRRGVVNILPGLQEGGLIKGALYMVVGGVARGPGFRSLGVGRKCGRM